MWNKEIEDYEQYFVDIREYEDYEIEEEYEKNLFDIYGDQDDENNEIKKWR